MVTITLVEDEPDLRAEVASFLTGRGHQVLAVANVKSLDALPNPGDVAVIDVMLPDGNGLDAVAALRQRSPEMGVVMLTALGRLQDKVSAYACGADNYLVKPVDFLELGAVVDALCRRVSPHWRLNLMRQSLSAPGQSELPLYTQETRLLEALARQPGKTLSRRSLVEFMGHDWLNYDERRLDTMISRLRKRWREHAGSELPLRTEHRGGYRFEVTLAL